MYGEQLASWGGSIPSIQMRGIDGLGAFSLFTARGRALYKKKNWTRADWAEMASEPLGFRQDPSFAKDYSALRAPFGSSAISKYMGGAARQRATKAKYWGKMKSVLKKEYKKNKARLDAKKKKKADVIKADKLKLENEAKQQELDTKIKTAEGSAQTQVQQVMQQWEMQSQGPAASGGGKILGMNKKTAMIAGGLAAAGVTVLILAT